MRKFFCLKLLIITFLFEITFVGVSLGQDYTFSLGNRDELSNEANVPIYPWFPDGHIAVLAEPENNKHIMYWSEYENYRTEGDFPFPEYQLTLSPNESIFGGRRSGERWDNGGSWLMSVFRQDGDNLVGFYHAEDHWDRTTNPEGIAWKSLARTTSNDNGFTWTEGEQIITSASPKPETPTWGGAGDNCVIWDHKNNRWISYYQEHWLRMAVSYDIEGKPGTWFKYYNGEFNEPGLEGRSSPIPGLMSKPGGNPSVHFNTYLEQFVMVWHSWVTTSIYISTSNDGIDWAEPKLLEPNSGSRRAWYPTIIGTSDTSAGKIARLYYADIAPGFASRDFVSKALVFDKEEEYHAQVDWQTQRIGEVKILGLMDINNDNQIRMVTFDGNFENNENIEYYFKDKEGAYVVSGRFQLDELYAEGSVGISVRSGLNDNDVMAAMLLSKDQLKFYARETEGAFNFSEKSEIEWSSPFVWLQIEKSIGTLKCRYSSNGEDWTEMISIPFEYGSSILGLFATGTPDLATVAYIEDLEEKELSTSNKEVELKNKGGFSNPSRNQVFLQNPESFGFFSIYDLYGRLQIKGNVDTNYLDVQNLNPGMYLLSLYDQNHKKTITEILIIL